MAPEVCIGSQDQRTVKMTPSRYCHQQIVTSEWAALCVVIIASIVIFSPQAHMGAVIRPTIFADLPPDAQQQQQQQPQLNIPSQRHQQPQQPPPPQITPTHYNHRPTGKLRDTNSLWP